MSRDESQRRDPRLSLSSQAQAAARLSLATRTATVGRALPISNSLSLAATGVAQSAAALKRPASVALPAPLTSSRPFTGAAGSAAASGSKGAGGAPPPPAGTRPGASQLLPRRALENQRPLFASGGPGGEPEGLEDHNWEFEGSASRGAAQTSAPPAMRGRLRQKIGFWQTFCRSRTVLQWIAVGFPLLWLAAFPNGPAQVYQRNHPSALNQQAFVSQAVRELLATRTAVAVPERPHCVMPLGVVPKPGTDKLRLIYDARFLNSHVQCPSFKYETLAGLSSVLRPGDQLFTVDLKSGYHHLDIAEDFWKYLGFEWEGQYYVFTQLPFGLAPACWAFTKLTEALYTTWRGEGHRFTYYIDDSLHAHQTVAGLLRWRTRVLADFESAGFIVSDSKCSLDPSTCKKYLGANVDTAAGCLTVPAGKWAVLRTEVERALSDTRRCSLRLVSVIVGRILSMSFSFGELSMLMTRHLVIWQNAHRRNGLSWNSHAPLGDPAVQELRFWVTSFSKIDGRKPLWPPSHVHTIHLFTDAAGRSTFSYGGWGGWAAMGGTVREAAGKWAFDTHASSSTFLEAYGLWHVITSLNRDQRLSNQRVLVHTDSTCVFHILSKAGSLSAAVHDVVVDLFWYTLAHNIQLMTVWVPRELNAHADALSKWDDPCDWRIHPQVYADLSRDWGPFSMDLFATEANFVGPQFFSYMWSGHARCAGINAFAQRWPARAWCNPPFNMVGRILQHARAFGSTLTLIVPFWPNAAWWHTLVSAPAVLMPFVWGLRVLGAHALQYRGQPPGPGQPPKTWRTLAFRLDFTQSNPAPLRLPAYL